MAVDADPRGVFDYLRDSARKQLPEPLHTLLKVEVGLEKRSALPPPTRVPSTFETSSIPDMVGSTCELEITKCARGSVRNDTHEAVRDALYEAIVDLVQGNDQGHVLWSVIESVTSLSYFEFVCVRFLTLTLTRTLNPNLNPNPKPEP